MEARQQRIADMVKSLLPCFEECRRKERLANIILIAAVLSFLIGWGYMLRDYNRPIDINEYTILTNVVALSAKETRQSPAIVTQSILARYHIEQLQDLKSRQWRMVLQYIAERQAMN